MHVAVRRRCPVKGIGLIGYAECDDRAHLHPGSALGRLEPLEEERFAKEDELQALIAEHPEVLDGEQMRPGDPLRWILITREQGIAESPSDAAARWAVDHLIVDQDAVPTLVEVKRGSSAEIRRTIVGQMLEYAAHAARTCVSIAESPSDAAARWAVDHLIVDQDAVPTLVEVKRGSSAEIRRTIVGQMLEYAAHAARTWTADTLRRAFEESTTTRGLPATSWGGC